MLSSIWAIKPEAVDLQEREAFERTVDFLLSVPLLKKQRLAESRSEKCAQGL